MRRSSSLLLVAALLTIPIAASAQTLDHLSCFKMKDPLRLSGVIDITTPQFGLEAGCRLSPAHLVCFPGMKTVRSANVSPILMVHGQDLRDDRICYRVSCPRPFPGAQVVTDQFRGRSVQKLTPRLLCTSAIEGPPAPTSTTMPDPAVGESIKCYKMKDSLKLQAVVDIDTQQFGLQSSCKVSSAHLFCVPGTMHVQHVNVPQVGQVGGSTLDDERLCYRVHCSNVVAPDQEMTDPFGTRTLTNLTPRVLCTPAVMGLPPTTTTSTSTSSTSTTFPAGTDPPLVCQRAIEGGGMAYAREMLQAVADCGAPGQGGQVSTCLASTSVRNRLDAKRADWATAAAPQCVGVDLRHHLGYLETCGAAPSSCTFPSVVLDAPGSSNDVLDCLACRIKETLGAVGAKLYNNVPEHNACHGAIATAGLATMRALLEQTNTCLQQSSATTLASCFTPDFAMWRMEAENACIGSDPFSDPGYSSFCSGNAPVTPGFCAAHALPCTFDETHSLSAAGDDDDLLDCLKCQMEEAVLSVGRDLHGANLCCTGAGCKDTFIRATCRNVGGNPARYRIDSVNTGTVSGPHGITVSPDGTLYLADNNCPGCSGGCIKKVNSGGGSTIIGCSPLFFPTGVAADASGNVYFSHRCEDRVFKIPAGGAVIPFAGTGATGHAGDGGPATAAQLEGPNRVQVGPGGNVYITESFLLGVSCGNFGPGSERIRMVDSAGIIHTIAGLAIGGSSGENGPATAARFLGAYSLWKRADDSMLIGEVGGERVVMIDPAGNLIRIAGLPSSPVGSHGGYGGPAVTARFYQNCGVSEDPDQNVIIGPMEDNRIALVDRNGAITGIAGTGEGSIGSAGDGGLAILGQAGCPEDVAVAPDGRIYFSDLQSSRIRVLTREVY